MEEKREEGDDLVVYAHFLSVSSVMRKLQRHQLNILFNTFFLFGFNG